MALGWISPTGMGGGFRLHTIAEAIRKLHSRKSQNFIDFLFKKFTCSILLNIV